MQPWSEETTFKNKKILQIPSFSKKKKYIYIYTQHLSKSTVYIYTTMCIFCNTLATAINYKTLALWCQVRFSMGNIKSRKIVSRKYVHLMWSCLFLIMLSAKFSQTHGENLPELWKQNSIMDSAHVTPCSTMGNGLSETMCVTVCVCVCVCVCACSALTVCTDVTGSCSLGDMLSLSVSM